MHGGLPHEADMPGCFEKRSLGRTTQQALFVSERPRVKQVRTDILLKGLCWRNHGPFFCPDFRASVNFWMALAHSRHVSRYQTNLYLIVPFQWWGVGAFRVIWGNIQEPDGRNQE